MPAFQYNYALWDHVSAATPDVCENQNEMWFLEEAFTAQLLFGAYISLYDIIW